MAPALAVAGAVPAASSAHGVWEQLAAASAVPAASSARSVWEQLADRLNPAYDRPQARPDIEARAFITTRGEAYYVAKSPSAGTYVRLAPDEYFLLGLMDGRHQVKDLVLAYLRRYHCFGFDHIAHLVAELRLQHFLTEEPRDAWGDLSAYFGRRSWTYRIDRIIKSYRYHEFPLTGLDGPLTALYRYGGWLCFTRLGCLLGVLLSVVGLLLFVHELTGGDHDPLRFQGSYTLGLLMFLALWMVTISLHETGHALTTKHFGCEVPRGGFMVYYGMPAFFTDTSDIWLAPRRARLMVSLAGMAAIWGLGGLAMLYVVLQHGSPLAPLAFQFAFVAYINNTLQLMPLLELDGYYVLMDWLDMPRLRARAFEFVRDDLWRKLKSRAPFSREERIFAWYGLLAGLYSGFALGLATYIWVRRLGRLLSDAWTHEGLGWRALVAVGVLAFGVPLTFGLAVKLRQLAQTAGRELAFLRHQGVEARARAHLDARALVGQLRFLGALGFAAREAVVSQLRLQHFRRGQYVIRQGEPGTRFYLIRRGEAMVLQGHDGRLDELATLRPGDYFGELALLNDRPASASVAALTALEVYALDRHAFEASIAPRLRDYGLTVQWIESRAELARMPLFRQVGVAALDALLERLQAEEYPAGATIIRRGQHNDRFYLVRRGRVRATAPSAEGVECLLGEAGPGEYFGELVLQRPTPSPVTVQATGPVLLWSLDEAGFQEVLVGQLHVGGALAVEAERRRGTYRRRVTMHAREPGRGRSVSHSVQGG